MRLTAGRWFCFATLGSLLLGLLIGCSAQKNEKQTVLRLANDAEPKSLDPQQVTGLTEYNILQALFEGLVRLDTKTLEPKPGVAQSWEISEDRTRYTFHLDPKARWSDGSPLTAKDFVQSWERILNPQFAAQYAFLLHCIKNAEAYNKGEIEDFSKVGVHAPSPHVLRIQLENPTPYFLSLQVHFAFYPVPMHVIEKYGDRYSPTNPWIRAGKHVSNGPYKLEEWKLGHIVKCSRNPQYPRTDHVNIPSLEFYPISDQRTEYRAFRAGQIHATNNVPSDQIQNLIQRDDPALRLDPDLGIYYYLVNVNKPPLDDPRVRKALSMAIERKQIAQAIRRRDEKPATGAVPHAVSNYKGQDIIEENTKKARQLLADAGFPDGENFPKLTLLYNTSDQHRQIAVAVQAMWRRKLGVDIKLVNKTWKSYLAARSKGNYMVARAGWIADYNDPMTFLEIWIGDSPINHSNWKNSQFDQLLAKASRTRDLEERTKWLQRAERILVNEAPIMPVFFYKNAYLVSPRVKNWHGNVMSLRNYAKLELTTKKSQ